jgi:hypothetical protein
MGYTPDRSSIAPRATIATESREISLAVDAKGKRITFAAVWGKLRSLSWLLSSSGGSRRPPVLVVQTKNRKRHDLAPCNRAVSGIRSGDALPESLTRPAPVEVGYVLVEHDVEVVLSEDDNVIEALASDAPQKPLASRIHQRSPHGRLQDSDSSPLGHAIEDHTEPRVPIADDELGTLPNGVALRSC